MWIVGPCLQSLTNITLRTLTGRICKYNCKRRHRDVIEWRPAYANLQPMNLRSESRACSSISLKQAEEILGVFFEQPVKIEPERAELMERLAGLIVLD